MGIIVMPLSEKTTEQVYNEYKALGLLTDYRTDYWCEFDTGKLKGYVSKLAEIWKNEDNITFSLLLCNGRILDKQASDTPFYRH